jgi:hypothetical protein
LGELLMRALYFGCRNGDVGHFMWVPGMRRAPHEFALSPYPGLPWDKVDAHFAPRRGPGRYAEEMPQGVAALHHKDGWTALSFWDRSVDSRGNSSSTFIFDAELDFAAALAAAREHFPTVVARYPFEIRPLLDTAAA